MPPNPPRRPFRISARGRLLELGPKTLIMGILNVTPDSFSDGGLYANPGEAVARAWQIAEDGADILDVGGESTRPGSQRVSADEELRRLLPVLEGLTSFPIPISVDTSKAEVARAALERGASLINDVTGLQKDPRIGEEVARFDAALILMHMRGEPGTMQLLSPSPDILAEIEAWAEESVARARNSGVSSTKIILDPGIGFGKTVTQNLEIILEAARLGNLGFPLLFGTSRKSFIGKILNRDTGERIWGTAATVAASIIYGAHMVRVHDVAAMRDVARVIDALVCERPIE